MGLGDLLVDVRIDRAELHGPAVDGAGRPSDQAGVFAQQHRFRQGPDGVCADLCGVQLAAGYLVDRWNVRWAYAGAVAWWSLAGMAAAFSPSLAVLMVLRALLGVGESFNWPCALRVT